MCEPFLSFVLSIYLVFSSLLYVGHFPLHIMLELSFVLGVIVPCIHMGFIHTSLAGHFLEMNILYKAMTLLNKTEKRVIEDS